jgi:hypothetical protein
MLCVPEPTENFPIGDPVPIPTLLFVLSQMKSLLPLITPLVPPRSTWPADTLLLVMEPEIFVTLRRFVDFVKVKSASPPKVPPSLN